MNFRSETQPVRAHNPDEESAVTVKGERRYRIRTLPYNQGKNPYLRLFYEALIPFGITCTDDLIPNNRWLRDNRSKFEAIHLHWPETLWRRRGASILQRLRRVVGLWRFLTLAAGLGIKRIWTLHNMEHHEGADWVDCLGYRVLSREMDLIICHSEGAADSLRRRDRPSANVIVMYHGCYEGVYPNPRPRAETLGRLGLDPVVPVVSLLGYLRRYKGIETACEAIRKLGGSVQLIIGGQPHPSYDLRIIKNFIESFKGIVLIDRTLDDNEYADVTFASDAVVLPYLKVTGSGALLAAWTLGRGVVASDLPFFMEMLRPEPQAGILFRTGDSAALANAIDCYLKLPSEVREAAAFRMAERHRWESTIKPAADAICNSEL